MKNISNAELESLIQDLIDKKITRKELAKQLNTDLRKLHKTINEVSQTNPELYVKYITVFPYQPKVREDIDYEALIIDIMRRNKNFKRSICRI